MQQEGYPLLLRCCVCTKPNHIIVYRRARGNLDSSFKFPRPLPPSTDVWKAGFARRDLRPSCRRATIVSVCNQRFPPEQNLRIPPAGAVLTQLTFPLVWMIRLSLRRPCHPLLLRLSAQSSVCLLLWDMRPNVATKTLMRPPDPPPAFLQLSSPLTSCYYLPTLTFTARQVRVSERIFQFKAVFHRDSRPP